MKGDRARAREARMYQAFNRQVVYANWNGSAALDPTEMLSPAAREAVAHSRVEPRSWGLRGGLDASA